MEASMEANTKNSGILIIGVTGRLGFELAKASLQAFHPTFCLVRSSSLSDPQKLRKVQILTDSGAIVLEGSLHDEGSLIEALKRVNVVICAVNSKQVLDQKPLISAIKQAGCIERFIPSEFGLDPDKTPISDMDQGFYSRKSEIRRIVEAEGIPYTYISCNFFMSYLLPSLIQPGLNAPPKDKVTIFGDGNVKGVFMKERDVAEFTIATVDDPRSLNKALYLRPPGNVYSMNELVELWENKIGKQLEKIHVFSNIETHIAMLLEMFRTKKHIFFKFSNAIEDALKFIKKKLPCNKSISNSIVELEKNVFFVLNISNSIVI